jgi:hypothetical protein
MEKIKIKIPSEADGVLGRICAHIYTHIHTLINKYTWREEGKVAECEARIRV